MSRLLNVISAHSGIRAFREFTDSFHNSFYRVTINTDKQGAQTALNDLVLTNIPRTGQSRKVANASVYCQPLPSPSSPSKGAGQEEVATGPRRAVPPLPF